MEEHPAHRDQLRRLNRARGQLDGIVKMINEGRDCVEILTQLRAARSALRAVEDEMLRTHVRDAIKDELARGRMQTPEKRIDELVDLLTRYGR